LEQRSEEWFDARKGKVTASRIGDILKTLRNGAWAASRRNYSAQLVTERLTGKSHERFYTNEYMDWGKDQEPAAKEAYAKATGYEIKDVGFVDHPVLGDAGASPDGLVGDEGLIEIKCLIPANHLELLLTEEIPERYWLQMMWQMACTGRQWCDFVSFDPSQKENMQLFIKRVHRDNKVINKLENDIKEFLDEVHVTVERLQAKYKDNNA
jgi:putative phage-type endonuclease